VSTGKGSLVPVLVFVHGTDYGFGGGHPYDPSMLVSQGQVIVVTMNYRLGILGKLAGILYTCLQNFPALIPFLNVFYRFPECKFGRIL